METSELSLLLQDLPVRSFFLTKIELMDRKLFLYYLKTKVILFVLLFIGTPTAMTIYINIGVTKLFFGTDPFTAMVELFSFVWWKSLLFLYLQSLFVTFLGSVFWNVGKVIYKNRQFFLM